MSFRITATIGPGRPNRSVVFDDGRLTGDPDMIELLELESLRLEGTRVGMPEGPATYTNHVRDATSLQWLAIRLWGPNIAFQGDIQKIGTTAEHQ